MINQISDLSYLSKSVIAVPPLCRDIDLSVNVEENGKLVSHLESGGVRILLYGGNANLYNIAVSEYAELLEVLESISGDETLVIPSVGPFYGNIVDQADILKGSGFPMAMILPTLFPASSKGIAIAVRHFVERSGIRVVLYIKDEGYISPKVVSELVRDDVISWIKYAVVRKNATQDSYLKELIEYVDPAMIVSGIGEQPAITHLNGFGLAGYTSGCVCIAPSKSMKMLQLIKSGDIEGAEMIRSEFTGLEDLRNEHGPIPVLHHAVSLSGVASTGSHLPLLSDLDKDLLKEIDLESKALLDYECL